MQYHISILAWTLDMKYRHIKVEAVRLKVKRRAYSICWTWLKAKASVFCRFKLKGKGS
jgi:hypothetical protein